MQPVSSAWKEAYEQTLAPQGFVDVSFGLSDAEAQSDMSASDNGHAFFSRVADVTGQTANNLPRLATMEQNMWLLDGNSHVLQSASESVASRFAWNAVASPSRVFSPRPVITLAFSRVHTLDLPGITIVWDIACGGEYATDFTVYVYKGAALSDSATVTGNTQNSSFVAVSLLEYDKITIEVANWCLPNHRARVNSVMLGAGMTFSNKDLLRFTLSESCDFTAGRLPENTIEFTIDNTLGIFDPYNDAGLNAFLHYRQQVSLRFGQKLLDGTTESIRAGTYYLDGWNTSVGGREASFSAQGAMIYLEDDFLHAMSGNTISGLFTVLRAKVALPPGTQWSVDLEDFGTQPCGALPILPASHVVQYIAQACMCVFYVDRDDTIRVEPRAALATDYVIAPRTLWAFPSNSLSKPIKTIVAKYYNYQASDSIQTVWEETFDVGANGVLAKFKTSAANPVVSVTAGTGTVTVTTDVPNAINYATFNVTVSSGPVTVTIQGYPFSSTVNDVEMAVLPEGETLTIDNPLITSKGHAQSVANWAKDLVSQRTESRAEWRADPRIGCADVVTLENKYVADTVFASDVQFSFTGAFRASGTFRTTATATPDTDIDFSPETTSVTLEFREMDPLPPKTFFVVALVAPGFSGDLSWSFRSDSGECSLAVSIGGRGVTATITASGVSQGEFVLEPTFFFRTTWLTLVCTLPNGTEREYPVSVNNLYPFV